MIAVAGAAVNVRQPEILDSSALRSSPSVCQSYLTYGQ